MKLKQFLASVLAAGVLSAGAGSANAALQLCLDDGAGGLAAMCVSDGGSGDANALAGVITYVGSYGAFFLNVATAVGDSANPEFGIDLNSVNVSFTPGVLQLSISETDLNWGVTSPSLLNFIGQIGGVAGGTIDYALYVDDSNTLFGTPGGGLVFSGSSGSGAFSAGGSNYLSVTDPFSMTALVTIRHSVGASTSFNFIGKLPEPGTLALLGLGLAGLALMRRRGQ